VGIVQKLKNGLKPYTVLYQDPKMFQKCEIFTVHETLFSRFNI
jgi:hypothetical protein